MQALTAQFKQYLQSQRLQSNRPLSPIASKNYISDTERFLLWLSRELQEDTIQPAHLTTTVFKNYRRWLDNPANEIKPATARRLLSTLRRFGKFMVDSQLAETDPTEALPTNSNQITKQQLLQQFKTELNKQKLSTATIKNYVSDVKNYLSWATNNIKITDDNSIKL